MDFLSNPRRDICWVVDDGMGSCRYIKIIYMEIDMNDSTEKSVHLI